MDVVMDLFTVRGKSSRTSHPPKATPNLCRRLPSCCSSTALQYRLILVKYGKLQNTASFATYKLAIIKKKNNPTTISQFLLYRLQFPGTLTQTKMVIAAQAQFSHSLFYLIISWKEQILLNLEQLVCIAVHQMQSGAPSLTACYILSHEGQLSLSIIDT